MRSTEVLPAKFKLAGNKGYAFSTLSAAGIEGVEIDRPFVLLSGPNGAGKSALMRAMRASIGIVGERRGRTSDVHIPPSPEPVHRSGDEIDRFFARRSETDLWSDIPATLDVEALAWTGQETWLFDSRATSSLVGKSAFDDDMMYHASMIAGGMSRVSHGQFVRRDWQEAVAWALGHGQSGDAYEDSPVSNKGRAAREAFIGDARSPERWLFIDEPETAIDTETLLLGLAVLLEAAEIGRLRVFCSSHSLLFAAGLVDHAKVRAVCLGRDWLPTQRIALALAADHERLFGVGRDLIASYAAAAAERTMPSKDREPERPKMRGRGAPASTLKPKAPRKSKTKVAKATKGRG